MMGDDNARATAVQTPVHDRDFYDGLGQGNFNAVKKRSTP